MRRKLAPCQCLCVVVLLSLAPSALAADPIRWKFNMGAQLSYNVVQEMTISTLEAGSDKLQSKSRQELDVTWRVIRANDAGDGVVEYKFDRIRSQMTLPNGHLEYDSAKEGPPAGMAAINAPLYAALVKSPVEITISPNGTVKSVTLPDAVKAAIKKVQTSATFGDLSKPEAFQASFLAGFPSLPAGPVASGAKWQSKSTADLGAAGKQSIDTEYVLKGRATGAQIDVKRTIAFEPGTASQRRVKEQSSSGELLFLDSAGHLDHSSLKQQFVVTVTADKHNTDQQVDQTIEVKFVAPKR